MSTTAWSQENSTQASGQPSGPAQSPLDPMGAAAMGQSSEISACQQSSTEASPTQGGALDGLMSLGDHAPSPDPMCVVPTTEPKQVKTIDDLAGDWVNPGEFISAKLEVDLPTSMPAITIQIGGEFSLTKYASGQKKLKVGGKIGAKVNPLKVSVSVALNLTLRGDDLVAALEDAVKQLVALEFAKLGVRERLGELIEQEKNYKWTDALKLYNPVDPLRPVNPANPINPINTAASILHTAKHLLVSKYDDELEQAYYGYNTFFRNNPEAGFDAKIGIKGKGKVGKVGFEPEFSTGVEDVDNISAEPYTEKRLSVNVKSGPNAVTFNYAKRKRGADQIKTASLKFTTEISTQLASRANMAALASNPTLIVFFGDVLARDVEAEGMGPFADKLNGLVNLSAMAGLASEHLKSMASIEFEGEWVNGRLRASLQTG